LDCAPRAAGFSPRFDGRTIGGSPSESSNGQIVISLQEEFKLQENIIPNKLNFLLSRFDFSCIRFLSKMDLQCDAMNEIPAIQTKSANVVPSELRTLGRGSLRKKKSVAIWWVTII
jgi:hypothetical protein